MVLCSSKSNYTVHLPLAGNTARVNRLAKRQSQPGGEVNGLMKRDACRSALTNRLVGGYSVGE